MNNKQILLDRIRAKGIKDRNIIAMILAQCYVESMGFTRLEESFAYTPERLFIVFKKYFPTLSLAQQAVKNGHEFIANTVYANRMGNKDFKSGDGWRYRGRGLIQLTGKSNYASALLSLDLDVLNNPDLLLEPYNASDCAIWFLISKPNFMEKANVGDVEACTLIVNGGRNGLNERMQAFNMFKKDF